MVRDISQLHQALKAGQSFEYLLFWGHRQKMPNRPDASCLSQWFAAEFILDEQRYASAEHWMMAQKARLFGDAETLQKILDARTPSDAKGLGRRVAGFNEAIWMAHCFDFVVKGNEAKFLQNPSLGAFLGNTKEQVLVEASPYDKVWGIGLGRDDDDAKDPFQWQGGNLLGFALMEVRSRLGD